MKKSTYKIYQSTFFKITFCLVVFAFSYNYSFTQNCGFQTGDGCPGTDYNNFGINSTSNAATIEYDNFVSCYHSSAVRNTDGEFLVWGERISATATNVLSPLEINSTNFPGLTGRPLKVTLGSDGGRMQGILLADNGLYAWGEQGRVLSTAITTNNNFQKITIGGNATGLPLGVSPSDVKMIQATFQTLVIVTCSGDVWVISQVGSMRGNNNTGNATTWYRVTTAEVGNPFLSDVIACRAMGTSNTIIALQSNGNIWTWGTRTFLGNNTAVAQRNRATQMVRPTTANAKMVAVTTDSYFYLSTDGNLYSLGINSVRQLGDWTTTERRNWIQPRYTSSTGQVMNNIAWISVQEHDRRYASVNVITIDSVLYAWGDNSSRMIGANADPANPQIPANLTTNDKVLAVESGGHTTMIVKLCETNFGYVGHRTNGSMGNGSSAGATENSYTFNTAPVAICGADANPVLEPLPPVFSGPTGDFCVSQPVFLQGTPSGGTYQVVSGPGTLTGNVLNFTGVGVVVVRYLLQADVCTGDSEFTERTFRSENCVADLSITKTSDVSFPPIGNTVVFTIEVTNNGTDAALNTVVTDLLPSGFNYVSDNSGGTYNPATGEWNIGTINNGNTVTLEITTTINASGNFTNTASVISLQADPDISNNIDQVTVLPASVDAIDDFFGPVNGFNSSSNIGNVLNNDILNNGPMDINDITLTVLTPALPINGGGVPVLNPSSGIVSLPALTPGGTYTIEYQICLDIAPTTCDTAIATIVVREPLADLSLNKTVSNPTPNVGETITFTISLTNFGPESVQGIEVTDVLSAGFTYQSDNASGAYNSTTGIWTIPNLLPATTTTLQISVLVNSVGTYTNFVSLDAYVNDPFDGNDTSLVEVFPVFPPVNVTVNCPQLTFDLTSINVLNIPTGSTVSFHTSLPPTSLNIVTTPTAVLQGTYYIALFDAAENCYSGANAVNVTIVQCEVDLAVLKTVSNSTPFVGSNVTFTITVSNNGIDNGTLVQVQDLLPSGYTYVSDNSAGNYNPLTGLWNIGNLGVSATTSLQIVATVNETGNYTNTATVSGNENDPVLTNNTSSVSTSPVNVIVANNDSVGPVNGLIGGSNIINVLDNDLINNVILNPTNVTLTPVTNGPLTVNANGSVDVAPNTPAGTYTVTYTICENINLANCDNAIVTVVVEAAEILANNDLSDCVDGQLGNPNLLNVLTNDLLNGTTPVLADVTIIIVTPDVNNRITLNTSTGIVSLLPETQEGTYTIIYRLCENLNPTNCSNATVRVTVSPFIYFSATPPSDCSVDNGFIEIENLQPSVTYTLNVNSTTTSITPTSSSHLVSNLADGTYNIFVTNQNINCNSNILNIVLEAPTTLNAPLGIGCD